MSRGAVAGQVREFAVSWIDQVGRRQTVWLSVGLGTTRATCRVSPSLSGPAHRPLCRQALHHLQNERPCLCGRGLSFVSTAQRRPIPPIIPGTGAIPDPMEPIMLDMEVPAWAMNA